MSIIPPGLVTGPALVPQAPLIPAVTAPRPVAPASMDSGASRQQQDGASSFLSQGRSDTGLTYGRPAPVEADADMPHAFVKAAARAGTASADAAAVNASDPAAEPARPASHAVANSAYAMIAQASAGLPASTLAPLRGG